MNLLAITGLLVLFPSLAVGIFTLGKQQKAAPVIWSGFCLAISIWGLGIYKIATSKEIIDAVFWWRIAEIGVIFIPVLLSHFTIQFLELKKKLFISLFYLITFIFVFLDLFTNYFINKVYFAFNQFYYISATPLYTLFIIIFLSSAVYNIYLLIQAYKTRTGLIKSQIRYLFLAFAIGFSGGITSYFPVYHINVYPFWNATILISSIMVSYAMLKYRLMDIRSIIIKALVYVLSFTVLISLGFLMLFLNNKLQQPIQNNVALSVILIIEIVLFRFVFSFFENLSSKHFYYTYYSYQKVLNDLSKKLTSVLESDKLIFLIIDTLTKTLKLDKIIILLREKDGQFKLQKNVGFNETGWISLAENKFLVNWIEKNQKPLSYEEISLMTKSLRDREQKEKSQIIQNKMKEIGAVIFLPLLIENKISGMIILGNKISGDTYSKQDVDLLIGLSNQASIALENAKSYSEIRGFSEKLQKEVERQTAELKRANEELKILDKAKSSFISIASHQLRTPLTAIKGYISLILEDTYGKLSKKLAQPLENVYLSNERLIRLVNDLLNVSRIEAGKIEAVKEKVSIEDIISSIIEELRNIAKAKNLTVKWEMPEVALPKISADPSKIRNAIFNVVDNAIRYTEKGGVAISTELAGDKLQVHIKDTGPGIEKKELAKLFSSFSRGAAGAESHTEGSGLGLYIAKSFVQMHNGKIWAESAGLGKGATFVIELPMN